MSFKNEPAPDKKCTAKFRELEKKLFAKAYTQIAPLEVEAWVTPEPVGFDEKTTGEYKKIRCGDKWAEEVFDCAWFHVTGEIPEFYKDENIVFLINCGGEGLIYTKEGEPKQSITCYASEYDKTLGMPEKKVVINRGLTDGRKIDFWIDGAANDLFGKMQENSLFSLMSVAVENTQTRGLYYDVQVLCYIYEYAENCGFTDRIYETLSALPTAEEINENNASLYREQLAVLLGEKNDSPDTFTYSAVGHAHLDLAWLWPLRETKRKGARTFTTQMMNMERYPEYIFGASQAQLYKWMKDNYPGVFEKVKKLAAEGRWELQGATWVEPDSNLISGESLIRQFYYGKRFYKENFGADMKIFWVPDSFGYSACIPQVMAQAEVPYFLTQKMSWSEVTRFPYHSFFWEGLDGTRVLAHMLPDETYNAPVRPDRMINGEKNYSERKISSKSAMLFGIGDGGAGPGFEHIERMRRLRDVKCVPKVNPRKIQDFFDELDDGTTPYPVYRGELYLEKHQGTYTTRSKNKKMNRKCEILLRNYEMLLCAAEKNGIELPVDRKGLDEIWQEILLYQFHDILPGSSINRVYEETSARYDIISDRLASGIKKLSERLFAGEGYFNPVSYEYDILIEKNGELKKLRLPAMGFANVSEAVNAGELNITAGENTLENDFVKITFTDGAITSYYDKKLRRDFVKNGGKMGVYSMYDDHGDCWDIKPWKYSSTKKDAVCLRFETGVKNGCAFAEGVYSVGNTVIRQTASLSALSPALKLDLSIDSHMQKSMLRLAFETSVEAEEAKFNIQFGHISRRTTENNPSEEAQFEVSAQKFVDISDEKAGISLINDCKYGYRCKHGVIDVDLIRSPEGGPGEDVDHGEFTVQLELLPHEGSLGQETYKQAYILNNPSLPVNGAADKNLLPLFKSSNENIVAEMVKCPDDGNGAVIRLYNASEKEQSAVITFGGKTPSEVVNILENHISEAPETITLKPFELINLRF